MSNFNWLWLPNKQSNVGKWYIIIHVILRRDQNCKNIECPIQKYTFIVFNTFCNTLYGQKYVFWALLLKHYNFPLHIFFLHSGTKKLRGVGKYKKWACTSGSNSIMHSGLCPVAKHVAHIWQRRGRPTLIRLLFREFRGCETKTNQNP